MSTGRAVRLLPVCLAASAACLAAIEARGQAQPAVAAGIEVLHVQGNVHVLAGAGANVVVQTGPLGVVVVDTGLAQDSSRVIAAVRTLSAKPIRYVINTHAHPDHAGGNAALASSGAPVNPRNVNLIGSGQSGRAEIIAYELVLNRMSTPAAPQTPAPVADWPTSTFSARQKEFFTNGEGIQITHQPTAHTDGDSVVFFRRSDVIAAGDVYSTESYPIIDAASGGSIAGVLDGLNYLLGLAIAGEKTEGGTMIVPGHGRISDEADLVEYRDMVTIVRDRIAAMVEKKMTVAQVQAARPTMEYDGLYGRARGWTTEQFVEAVYRGLTD